ncbi:MazG nucleotide pyrophosphohydrolase domain-containing protein [Arthrobacter mobilis]|uniref:Nucleotide pyrophosphohydrolase n=1 Tax=Arthrobacter mobilis TaxID=2724944 RepID=A0A7X6K382_9MICC|nr:MazG nucleotide pyrophosphohydrolase domain-containing protein [Arthrobacter mobilis]NKX53230.1 nucleotide pyrophosphohydrolase [Arthrobacter mobilis]
MTTAVERLLEVVAQLREHCLWTRALTHDSLVEYLLEEAHELAGTIAAGHTTGQDAEELKGELADVLYQVVLHARLQEEQGRFSFEDVAAHLAAKLIRRNRHVFRPDGTLQERFPATLEEIERSYDAVKAAERPERTGPFAGLPASLPALTLAAKSLDRARRSGIPVPGPAGNGHVPVQAASDEELGELLLGIAGAAAAQGLDPEQALRRAVRRFQDRVMQERPGRDLD